MTYDPTPIINAWHHWEEHKEEIPYYGFRQWLRTVYGFEYDGTNNRDDIVVKVLNEKKYMWFLLKWS
jgi:hypothetical protein